jgi:dienelactone hydrolase
MRPTHPWRRTSLGLAGIVRHPAVLVVGGSEGGRPLRPAAWLASHGYVALALAYFRFEDLPPQLESIPLEYFQEALRWMGSRGVRRVDQNDSLAETCNHRGLDIVLGVPNN